MKEQLKLFDIPQCKKKKKIPLYYIEIIEESDVWVIWQRAWSEAQAKKLAARKYNKARGFCEEKFVKFQRVETVEKVGKEE
ncbi:MAG: hypothetical protein PHF45_01305 [Candidatus Pacebacteria bacterium]|nr:hypothetical protein [Candidatus Paceibacterota bacterium]